MLLCGMRCDGMTIRTVAPPGVAIANDVDTIRYASPISGYPRTDRAVQPAARFREKCRRPIMAQSRELDVDRLYS